MGEAKKREAANTARFRRIMELWSGPDLPDEAAIAREIDAIPPQRVGRAPLSILEANGMKVGECHANCGFIVREDPVKSHRMVTGFMTDPFEGMLVLHSVVERNGEMICITPTLDGSTSCEFRPDPSVEMREEEHDGVAVYRFYRKGVPIRVGVRRDPEATRERCRSLIARLDAGESYQSVLMSAR